MGLTAAVVFLAVAAFVVVDSAPGGSSNESLAMKAAKAWPGGTTSGGSGEEVCEFSNPYREDKEHCLSLGCCHFNENPLDVEGFGLCWSSVGNEFCSFGGGSSSGGSGEEVCEINNPDPYDKAACLALGCCHFNEDPADWRFGMCWSSVGEEFCEGQHPTSGEYVCERMNPDRRDPQLCAALPCCHFNTNPYDPGFGLCWSNVDDGSCYAPDDANIYDPNIYNPTAVGAEVPQHPTSGEDVCERMNPNRRDHQLCAALPCCHFNRNPYDPGFGLCWSSVGNELCSFDEGSGPLGQHPISGEDVCEWMNPNRRNFQLCKALPCCHFNTNPYDPGFGLCWSSVGDGSCYDPEEVGPYHYDSLDTTEAEAEAEAEDEEDSSAA